MTDSVKVAGSASIVLSLSSMIVCLVSLPFIYQEVHQLQRDLQLGMREFVMKTDTTWRDMVHIYPKFARSTFSGILKKIKAKRQIDYNSINWPVRKFKLPPSNLPPIPLENQNVEISDEKRDLRLKPISIELEKLEDTVGEEEEEESETKFQNVDYDETEEEEEMDDNSLEFDPFSLRKLSLPSMDALDQALLNVVDSYDSRTNVGEPYYEIPTGGVQTKTNCQCASTAASHCPAGPSGPPGTPGDPGDPGQDGDPGKPGVTGEDIFMIIHTPEGCITCPAGPPGRPGIPGRVGGLGSKGQPGKRGMDTPRGSSGARGRPGMPGMLGTTGNPGRKGPPGRDGRQGKGTPGVKGPLGVSGFRGRDGNPGAEGTMGSQGSRGTPGPTGTDGTPGAHGPMGLEGRKGIPGNDAQYCPCAPRSISVTAVKQQKKLLLMAKS